MVFWLRVNPDKCNLITRWIKDLVINVENKQIPNSKSKKILGIKIDHKLTFNAQINEISKKAGKKMNALSRVMANVNIEIRCTILNVFLISQLNYFPLTWMCHSRAKPNKINCQLITTRCLLLSNYWKRIFLSIYKQCISVLLRYECLKLLNVFTDNR